MADEQQKPAQVQIVETDPEDLTMAIAKLASKYANEAFLKVLAIARYGESDKSVLQASELILAYAVGKPVGRSELFVTPNGGAPRIDYSQLTDEELAAIEVLKRARLRLTEGK